jgi:ribosomal peptide maturation radical SAM protein 1
MYKIALINMPFGVIRMPSLALTQLKSVVEAEFKDRVSVKIHYLNHDFAHYLGIEFSQMLSMSTESYISGIGDWIFRQAAFPELPDNTETYLRRFFPMQTPQLQAMKQVVLQKRKGLNTFLSGLIDKYGIAEADLVGFTSMFSQNVSSFALARKLKEKNPKIITVMGGASCEAPMGQEIAKNFKPVDFVFSGPGLKSFPQFVRHCLDGEFDKCHSIRGVFSRRNCGLGTLTPLTVIGEEVDIDVPIKLDYGEFLETYHKQFGHEGKKPILLFETSRGCWWGQKAHCTFCGLNGQTMNYRAMAPEKALAQFNHLFNYAKHVDRFDSVDNIMPKPYMQEVFARLEPPANVGFFYEVKADLTDEEVQILSRAHVRWLQPGVESLNTSTLKLMKKGTSVFQNLRLLKSCIAYDVHPGWNLLIGFPGEHEDVYKKYLQDIPLLTHLTPPADVFPVRFDRYSPYFKEAKEYGLDLAPMDYYAFIYPFSSGSLMNLAYYFKDRNLGAEYLKWTTKWIRELRGKVDQWRAMWDRNKTQPQLFLKENGHSTHVHDSRTGKAIEHDIGEIGRQVLAYLDDKPKELSDLAKKMGHISGFDAAREIAALQSKGLIFQEGERYLSLVLPKEPPKMTSLRAS